LLPSAFIVLTHAFPTLQEKELAISLGIFGYEYPEMMANMANSASMYRNEGRQNEDEELQAK